MNTQSAAAFYQQCFKELLADGQPHKVNEVFDYINDQMEENGLNWRFSGSNAFAAIRRVILSKDNPYIRASRGVYQMEAPLHYRETMFSWSKALDCAFELSQLLEAGLSGQEALADMTAEEAENFNTLASQINDGVERVIDGMAILIAQLQDHEETLTAREQPGMEMSM